MRVITTTVTARTSPFWRNWASNAYRFSVEWSRIEPECGYVSRAALDHYRRMVESCLGAGLTPVVTLNHFTLPRWLATDGGWASPGAALRFAQYASCVTGHLGDLLSWRL
jgi:beta-glucosidase